MSTKTTAMTTESQTDVVQTDEFVFNDATECQLLRGELHKARALFDALLAEKIDWHKSHRMEMLFRRIQTFVVGEGVGL